MNVYFRHKPIAHKHANNHTQTHTHKKEANAILVDTRI